MKNIQECDVLVVGGGPSGIAAAVAAARAGSHVVLLERYGFLGGLASSALTGTICGAYLRNTDFNVQYVSGGFLKEWVDELARVSCTEPISVTKGLHVLPYDSWALQRMCDTFLLKECVTLVLHGTLLSVQTKKNNIAEVDALVWDRKVTFRPSTVIDCTGEATLFHLSGAEVKENTGNQSAAVIFSIQYADLSINATAIRLSLLRDIARAVQNERLSPGCAPVSFVPSMDNKNGISLKVNIPYKHPEKWNRMTELELQGRRIVDELFAFLTSESPLFQQATLSQTPVQIGIRAGRHAVCQFELSEDDFKTCREFPDGVACGAWPMEEWGDNKTPTMTYMPPNRYYEIPSGCLISKSISNLYVAGRAISATSGLLASARVIGTSLCTGWAAGKMATAQAKKQPLTETIQILREEQVRGIFL